MTGLFGQEYVQGYTSALLDVEKVLEYIQEDMKRHKRRQSVKEYKNIIKCMINNRAVLREEPYAFVRCNDKADGGYEVYIEREGVYYPEEE